jgi:hypothetical protein
LCYQSGCVVLTCTFWACFLLPGLALVLGCFPGLARFGLGGKGRALGWPFGTSSLSRVGYAYAGSLLLASPFSLLCYALKAPLWCFSAALCALACLGALGLALHVRQRFRRPRLRFDAVVPCLCLLALLWLQGRVGGWLDGMHGDVTVYVARMRVLLEHGFTNRDTYLADYRFQHVYHNNLLLAVYASAAQLTGQSEITTWFSTEVWAKLCVAAGHAVLGERLTGRRYAGTLLALAILTLTAAETYTLYPNALSVGYFLPMLLAHGMAPAGHRGSLLPRPSAWLAGLTFIIAQVHAAYAVYAVLLLGPWFGLWGVLGLLRRRDAAGPAAPPRARSSAPPRAAQRRALSAWLALLCLSTAAPFLLVSAFGQRDERPLSYAPEGIAPPMAPPPRTRAGVQSVDAPRTNRAADALGGHLEAALEPLPDFQLVFMPERIGGWAFLLTGFACNLLAIVLYRGRRLPLMAAALAVLWISAMLFVTPIATKAAALLQGAFVVARLSTVLTSLLIAVVCAVLAWPIARLPRGRGVALAALSVSVCVAAALVPAHAPESFRAHVTRALAPESERFANLDKLAGRREVLRAHIPPGSTVLTTAYFARQVVMLCDCYVLAADRGHSYVLGIDQRRRDLAYLNEAGSEWAIRQRLLRFYNIDIVVFERRWRQRYAWAYQHGKRLGGDAGIEIVRLDLR